MNDVLATAPVAPGVVRLPATLYPSHLAAQAGHFIRQPSMERDSRVLQPNGQSSYSSREHSLQHQQSRAAADQPPAAMSQGAPFPTPSLTDGGMEGLQTSLDAAKENRKKEKNAPRKGDIRYLDHNKRKRYNGRQWRTLCIFEGCEKEAQGKTDVCSRHLSRPPVLSQQKGLKATGVQKHCLSLTSSLPPLSYPSGTSTPTEDDSQDSLSFGAASGKRSCSSVSELSNASPISNMSEREQEAAQGLVSLSNSRTNTPFPHTPISSPDFTSMQGKQLQAFSTPLSQHLHNTSGHVDGPPSSKRGQFQRHSSQGSLLDEGIYMSRHTCASVPPLTEDRMDISSVEKQSSRAVSEVDVPPEDMELACMESSDSALPEDFPTTTSESQLSNTASSSTCLLSDEVYLATSTSTASTVVDMAGSYQKLPPLREIARRPTRQRMELMSQLPRSHSVPDLKSNVYELQQKHSVSPPGEAAQLYPVRFTEKPLLKAHQPKVSPHVMPSNEAQMEQNRLPHVSTANGQLLVKSQVSAFFTPQKQGAVGNTSHGLPHHRDGVRFMQSGPSPSLTGSPPTWAMSNSATVTVASRSERAAIDIARLSLHSSSPSPVANLDLLTPPFTPSQVSAPPLPHPLSMDGTATFPSTVAKRNGGFPRQVNIAPKSSYFDMSAAQQLSMSNTFKRKRARPSAVMVVEDNQSAVGCATTVEQELPPIQLQPKLYSCRKNFPKQREKWCPGCEKKKGGCVNLNAGKKR